MGLGLAGLALRHLGRPKGVTPGALRRRKAGGKGRDNEAIKKKVFGISRQTGGNPKAAADSRTAAKDRFVIKNPLRTGR